MLGIGMLGCVPLGAVVLFDTGDTLANTSAPTGIYEDSGWAYQGRYGSFLGTMIGSQYFITAAHIGVSASPTFTSVATDVTYTIDASANGGVGFWNITGTDLRIFKINESFGSWAELYTGGAEAGADLVVFGRGGPRGAEVIAGGDVQGWYHTASDGVVRWGANDVEDVISYGGAEYLRADFDAVSGLNEATLSSGDSGGAVFILDGGVWKLAGINYGVDGPFDMNDTPGDGSEFHAALFERDGLYTGGGAVWNPAPAGSSSFYASRISSSAGQIQAIVAVPVPEPGTWVLMAVAGGWLLGLARHRKTVLPSKHLV